MGERERERKRKRKRERERERRERRREYLAGSYYSQWDENCITYVFTRQFSRVLTPGHSSLGFSRESPAGDNMLYYVANDYNGELISLIGNQRVGIFPPKSKILFVLSLALIWCRNFQDRTIPVGGDTQTSSTSERRIKTRYTSARQYVMPCESGRWSRDHRPTVKQRFLDVSSDLGKFWKKSLNGHATVVGGHATVGRLSNNVFWTFQAIRKFFLKKVAERSHDSGRRSRDRRLTVFGRFKQLGNFL